MKTRMLKYLFLAVLFCGYTVQIHAQKRKSVKRTNTKTKTNIQSSVPTADTTLSAVNTPPPPPVAPAKDSIPLPVVKKSLRPDEAVESSPLKERIVLPYEHLRADDAVYRHRLWREIDTREKMNQVFSYSANEDNGNQRFISILLGALQDSTSGIVAFSGADDRFTTPLTTSEIAKAVVGEEVDVPDYDSLGNLIGTKKKRNDVNLDSFYKFHVKEEVIFDKESSRLFWRILGIAPVKNVETSTGVKLGEAELFWVYYPDIKPLLAKHDVYNGKNFGGRMTWEDLFENRIFTARIIKSTMDNPRDVMIKNTPGLSDNSMLQLYEGENIKEKIFNYEQDLWSY
jgi:gliding motility associated protien GldN